jgi:hypothetical protein
LTTRFNLSIEVEAELTVEAELAIEALLTNNGEAIVR